jgi:hypothetical protein
MKKRFLTPLDQACRKSKIIDQFSYVYFKDGFVYVSNGRVHIKQHMSLHEFSDTRAKELDGYCIQKDVFKLINRHDVQFDNIGINVIARFEIAGTEVITAMKSYAEAPGGGLLLNAIDSVFDQFNMKMTQEIALDPDTVTMIRKIFVTKTSGFTFRFNSGKAGVLVTPNQNDYREHAIIVPLSITGKYKNLK